MPNIVYVHPKLRHYLRMYDKIRHCLGGSEEVKAKRMLYLPMPDPEDTSEENLSRYRNYLTRAIFMNVAQQTQNGLVGQIFMRDPITNVPAILQPIIDDATGEGVPAVQLAQDACMGVLAYGRKGLYVDYPYNEEPASQADLADGTLRASLKVVDAWDIINWRKKCRGSKIILSLVVFREDYLMQDDGFETRIGSQWRVLRLDDDDVFNIDVYRDKLGGAVFETYIPKDFNGNPFNEIAFKFIGSMNNDSQIDEPPMFTLCDLNIGHYRNSADYEESVFICGQPTVWASGLSEEWVKNVLGGRVALGVRGGLPLPLNGAAGLLQAEPNQVAKEAMDQKEAQMLAMGAKLIEGSQTERTATEATYDNLAETSVLSTVAKNVSSAFIWALEWAAYYMIGAEQTVDYQLNSKFDLMQLSAADRLQALKEWQSGGITFSEYRSILRGGGIATLDDNKAKTELAAEEAQRLSDAVTEAAAMAKVNPDPNSTGAGDGG